MLIQRVWLRWRCGLQKGGPGTTIHKAWMAVLGTESIGENRSTRGRRRATSRRYRGTLDAGYWRSAARRGKIGKWIVLLEGGGPERRDTSKTGRSREIPARRRRHRRCSDAAARRKAVLEGNKDLCRLCPQRNKKGPSAAEPKRRANVR